MDTLSPIIAAQLFAGVVIAALTARELLYLRELWHASQTTDHPERSWLLGALVQVTATILVGCCWFLVTLGLRLWLGPVPWTPPISALVIIALLLVPRRIGHAMRRREADARERALEQHQRGE